MNKTVLPRGSLQFYTEVCKLVQLPGAGCFAHPWINCAELHYNRPPPPFKRPMDAKDLLCDPGHLYLVHTPFSGVKW